MLTSISNWRRICPLQLSACRTQPDTNLFEYQVLYLRSPHFPHKPVLTVCLVKIVPTDIINLHHFLADAPVWELLVCPSAFLAGCAAVGNDTTAAASHIHPT